MWELAVIGCLILFITGIAMRKHRRSEFNSFSSGEAVDTDELARKIGQEVGKEFRAALKELRDDLAKLEISSGSRAYRNRDGNLYVEDVSIDESIIPTNLKVDVETTNLDGATKEQKTVDKGLGKSKSKLAELRGKKEK